VTVSTDLKTKAFAQETDDALIILLTITHDDLPAAIRVCSNSEDIESNGEDYLACPFDLKLLVNDPQQLPKATLSIQNVDRRIVEAIRSIGTAPEVEVSIIKASDPDTVEMSLPNFSLLSVTYDALTVQGDLFLENMASEPYPAGSFSPSEFRGGF
jgi:hypothetical protein